MENGAQFWEKRIVIGDDDVEFGCHLELLNTYCRQRDLTLRVFLEYLRFKKTIFVQLEFRWPSTLATTW